MANGFGPGIVDFSPLANLGQTFTRAFDDSRKRQETEEKRAMFRTAAQGGDLNKIGLALLGAGDVQSGAALLGLGQKSADRESDAKILQSIFGGTGGASAAPKTQAPSAPGVASDSLVQNESGGNWQAQNNAVGAGGQRGHFGRLQFGQARLQEAAAAGAIPPGTTPQQFMQSPELQQSAERWHFGDIDNFIKQKGYDRAVGQMAIGGVPVTVEGMRAVAHLGGKEGLAKFIETEGRYNPADVNGTRLSDYFARHGGGGAQPTQVAAPVAPVQSGGPLPPPGVQVAENEADVQRIEAQMPGYGGGQPQQGAPVQVAQAQPQPGAPQSDVPAQGAAPAQGFVVPGTGAVIDQQTIANNPRIQNMVRALGLVKSDQARAAINKQLEIEMADIKSRQDQGGPLDRENKRLQNEKLRREVGGEGARPMTPQERAAYNVPEGQPAYMNRQGEPKFGPAGTKIVNEAQRGENKFEEELGKGQAKRFNDMISEGDVAQGRIADLQTLREASRRLGSQGSSANLKALVGPYAESLNIKVDGLSDIQLYESITQRLAPTLRQPGSGSQSDIEFKGFLRAIGPLSNTPAAREMILDTFEAASRNDIARADIASRLAQKEITRGQAEKELRALPNPLESFREFRKQNPDLVGQAIKETATRSAAEKRDPVKVTSPDEARKLPSGTRIILPDGRPGVVP